MSFTTLPTLTVPLSPPPSDNVPTTSTTPLAHPDSTHQPYSAPFTEGEDILVHDPDGLIYFGIVVEVEEEQGQCLVRFGDCTERWSNFYELRRLSETAECEELDQDTPNLSDDGSDCGVSPRKVNSIQQLHKELQNWEEEKQREVRLPQHVLDARSQLSYDWDSLVWDEAHERNQTETYCYCGEKGEWYKKMLQCADCLQWFHQECIRALSYQLMCGDRFFKFICTLCNGTHEETIQRLDLGIVDALHLVILNLIISKNQKFHDLEISILPFMKKKLKYLTGDRNNPQFKQNKIETENIVKILASNKTRFMCGSETGQQSSLWGLRKMMAPWLPSKYLMYTPKFCREISSKKRLKETLIKPNNKNGVFQKRKRVGKNHVKGSLKRGRLKDLTSNLSDSDASSFGTLDLLIKPPKDFSGRNNPFSLMLPPKVEPIDTNPASGEITPVSGNATPNSTNGTIKLFLSEKESPLSSGAASNATGEESRSEMLHSVEQILNSNVREIPGSEIKSDIVNNTEESEEVFKTPGLVISDLKTSLSSYFAPNAKSRIDRGEQFQVKARRLTLEGDIAYLIDWEEDEEEEAIEGEKD